MNVRDLRVGDWVLVEGVASRFRRAEIVHADAYGVLAVRFQPGNIIHYFDRKTGYSAILGAARRIGGQWQPL